MTLCAVLVHGNVRTLNYAFCGWGCGGAYENYRKLPNVTVLKLPYISPDKRRSHRIL